MSQGAFGYVVAAALFAAVGVVVGYLVYASAPGGWPFGFWAGQPFRFGSWSWYFAGALFGLGARYLMVHR